MLRLALAEFGFEQERALGRDGDARFQPIDDLDPSTSALAGDDSGRKKPLGGPDEYDLAPFLIAFVLAPLLEQSLRRYQNRAVEAALVWTDGPKLMAVPQSLMEAALSNAR